MHTKFMICLKKKNFFKIFDLKGAIEKCVDCFLVYPFQGSLFFSFSKKRDHGMRGSGLAMLPVLVRCKLQQFHSMPFEVASEKLRQVQVQVQQCSSQKHLEIFLDNKLDFNKHLDEKIKKGNKIIGMMKKLCLSVSRKSLLSIYKSFIRPN